MSRDKEDIIYLEMKLLGCGPFERLSDFDKENLMRIAVLKAKKHARERDIQFISVGYLWSGIEEGVSFMRYRANFRGKE